MPIVQPWGHGRPQYGKNKPLVSTQCVLQSQRLPGAAMLATGLSVANTTPSTAGALCWGLEPATPAAVGLSPPRLPALGLSLPADSATDEATLQAR